MEILRDGIVHYVSQEIVIVSQGSKIYKFTNSDEKWELWCSLPTSLSNSLISSNRWIARLSRREVHHVQRVNEQIFVCIAFGRIFLIKASTGDAKCIGTIKGSRPLRVCSDGNNFYYGVYISNKEREPIELYSYNFQDDEWVVFYTFKDIRHIHGTFWDYEYSKLWVTTGDLNHESSIIYFDKDSKPEKLVTGSQQSRAVDLLFTESSIFYASDAPHESNYIYRLNRKTGKSEKVQKVGGPVFWGRNEDNLLFFSTVVEPSEVNRTDAVELWCSNDKGNTWDKFKMFEKDIGHMKLFQYGQLKFPSGPGDNRYLWFTPYGTKFDHNVVRIPLSAFQNKKK